MIVLRCAMGSCRLLAQTVRDCVVLPSVVYLLTLTTTRQAGCCVVREEIRKSMREWSVEIDGGGGIIRTANNKNVFRHSLILIVISSKPFRYEIQT